MYQIDNATAATTLPAISNPGKPGFFTDGNPGTGQAPTIVPAEFLNTLMMEMCNVAVAAGLTPTKGVLNQMAQAIQMMAAPFIQDTGAANAYVTPLPVVVQKRTEGQVIRFKPTSSNTGPCTLNDGLGVLPLVGGAHQPLQGGEIVGGGDAWAQLNGSVGSNGSYILLECTGGALQVGNATQSGHAVNLGQLSNYSISPMLGPVAIIGSTSNTSECDVVMQSSGKKVAWYMLPSGEAGLNDAVAGINRLRTDNLGNFYVPTLSAKVYIARAVDDGTGSALQVGGTASFNPGTQSAHGATLGQIAAIVGSSRNASMVVDTASSSATFRADEIVVESALGGLKYAVANINLTVNLATTGDGGMDSGTAPAPGFVALYLLYNPAARIATIRAVNATSGVAPEIYPNSYPGSYTASALIAVYPTDSSGKFLAGSLMGRDVVFAAITAISGSTQQLTLTPISISSAVPANAKSISGFVNYGSSAASNTTVQLSPSTNQVGLIPFFLAVNASAAETVAFSNLRIRTAQSICYLATVSGGTISFTIFINGYSF